MNPNRARLGGAMLLAAAWLVLGAHTAHAAERPVHAASPAAAQAAVQAGARTAVQAAGPTGPTQPNDPGAPSSKAVTSDPAVTVSVPGQPSRVLQVILLITVLGVAPAALLLCTSFTKIVVVLSLTRSALGTPSIPPPGPRCGPTPPRPSPPARCNRRRSATRNCSSRSAWKSPRTWWT